ncbi:MAG: hypothetical protein R3F60_25070 [bacterium]
MRFLAPLLVLALAGPALAHRTYTRPDLHVTCKVGQSALLCGLSLPERVLVQILGHPMAFQAAPTPAQQTALRDELARVFLRANPVLLDGQRVDPEVREVTLLLALPHDALDDPALAVPGIRLHQSDFNVVRLVLARPFQAPPRQISFTWDLDSAYTTTSPDLNPEPRLPIIPVNLLYEGQWTTFEHTPEEPGFTFHAPRATPAPAPPPPPVPVPASLRLPLVAAGLGLLGLLIALALRRRRALALGALLAAGAAVPATWSLAGVDVPLPWTRLPSPGAAEARQIFEALHRGVYRAFDFAQEDAIYDALAGSVDGPLLDWMYGEIYRGLVLQEGGGAVARVDDVILGDTELLPPPDPDAAAFQLRARWQVVGTVEHWGHAHQRTNAHQAVFTIDRRPGGWRITAMTPERQDRVVP